MKAHIQFKYIHENKKDEEINLKFENPVFHQKVYKLEDVQSLINRAEEYQSAGYYVVLSLAYESAPAFDKSLEVNDTDKSLATMQVYKNFVDNFESKSMNSSPSIKRQWLWTENKEKMMGDIKKIQQEIILGNTYQVNYTTRLTSPSILGTYEYFQLLTYEANGNYQAFIEDEEETFISISPELFFQKGKLKEQPYILTKPMKGTIGRGIHEENDKEQYKKLKNSRKDRAENVMIVDLLRNDISKISKHGTVRTRDLFLIEKYKTVFQMTSTIVGDLADDLSLFNIFKALFPCGSITGAPKEATMRIIKQLENEPRGIYCGTIGILLPDKRAIFNVPIRTIQNNKRQAIYGVGAGITIDSVPELEIEEFQIKSNILNQNEVQLIETMRLESGQIKRKQLHTKRLLHSAKRWGIPVDINEWHKILIELEQHNPIGTFKVRALLNVDGTIAIETTALQKQGAIPTAKLSKIYNIPEMYLTHKTTMRKHFEHDQETDFILYYNEGNKITEFNIGNIVIKNRDSMFTPTYKNDMLNGCMRQSLLNDGIITEREIKKDDLIEGIKRERWEVYMVNSLREWVQIDLKI